MSLLSMMRATAIAGVLSAVVSLALFGDIASFRASRFEDSRELLASLGAAALIALWLAAPLPAAYLAARRLASTRASRIAALTGMLLALAAGIWMFEGAISTRQTESLAGLVLFFAPVYQYGLLALALAVAVILRRWPDAPTA